MGKISSKRQSLNNPSFIYEKKWWQDNYHHIAGVDEVGRGAVAGPLVAAAVILSSNTSFDGIKDSKCLTPIQRERWAVIIKEKALAFGIGLVDVDAINQYGIKNATEKAMSNALCSLSVTPQAILIDAFLIPSHKHIPQEPIIKGDQKSITIAAASIVAKVYRDALMVQLGMEYKDYDFASHKGYGTKKHKEAIEKFGITSTHRTQFVQSLLSKK